jgi:hypothetical protein
MLEEISSIRELIFEKSVSISSLYKSYKTNPVTERLRAINKRENAMTVRINFVYLS